MKKVLAAVLACAMMLSLAACQGQDPGSNNNDSDQSTAAAVGTDSNASGEAHLTFSWWGNQIRNERTQEVLDMYSQEYSGVTFDVQVSDWGDYWNKLATASAGHALPDLVQMDYKYLKQYADNGMLLDLTPYIESGALDAGGIEEGILKSGTVDGGVYAISAGVNAPALLYNKTLLNENGISIKDNMTMDEFYAVCKEVYEKTGVKTNISYGLGENYIDYTLRGQGLELYSEDGKALGVSSAEDLQPYFEIYENGIAEGWLVSPEIFAERSIGTVEQDPLVYGSSPDARSWCNLTYSNAISAVWAAADADGIEVEVTTWPSVDPAASNFLKPAMFYSVTVDSKNPDEAVRVLNYLTNSVEANQVLLAERGIPASSVVTEGIIESLDEYQKMAVEYINNVVTPNSSPISAPAPDNSAEVLELLDQLQEQVCYGQITAVDAAEKLFTEGNKILAE